MHIFFYIKKQDLKIKFKIKFLMGTSHFQYEGFILRKKTFFSFEIKKKRIYLKSYSVLNVATNW